MECYSYGDFGAVIVLDSLGAVLFLLVYDNFYVYVGRLFDVEMGFVYFWVRYLDP